MARQTGIIKLSGTIGDINFFVVKGKGFAREAGGGFNGPDIKTKESMRRVRENGSEFGHCSGVKKTILQAFHPYILKRDRGFHGKCMSLFTKLKSLDLVSKRGQRLVQNGFQTSQGKQLFRDFPFGKPMEFLDAMAHRWHFDAAAQRLEFPAFICKDYKDLKERSELKLSLFLVDFNFEKLEFERHLLDEKTVLVEEENSGWVLFPATLVPVRHTAIFYVGVEVLNGADNMGSVLGIRVV